MSMYRKPKTEQGSSPVILIIGLALLAVLAVLYVFETRKEHLSSMSAVEAHVALGDGAAQPVTEIEKARTRDVYYHVVLHDVPVGWGLELSCEWLEPGGGVARHNFYKTRLIYKSTWPTHCRQEFGPAAPAGEWHVRLLNGPRVLKTSSFILK
jgi:hypothetical protein